jgi:hypothetical protein
VAHDKPHPKESIIYSGIHQSKDFPSACAYEAQHFRPVLLRIDRHRFVRKRGEIEMLHLLGPEEILEIVEKNLGRLVVFVFSAAGIVVALYHLKEFLIDHWVKRYRPHNDYRLRTTIVKDMMKDSYQKTTKLRRLRAVKHCNELILDPWPHIIPENPRDERLARLKDFYAVPGRLGISAYPGSPLEKKFKVFLDRDEALRPHREYSTLVAYVMNEKIDATLLPPYFAAIPPVGKESFTYEAHFPPDRRYVRDQMNPESTDYPKIKVYEGPPPPDNGRELRYEPYKFEALEGNLLRKVWMKVTNKFRTRYHVSGGRHDFEDGNGEHDWFRVVIFRPPQDAEVSVCWCMEGDAIVRPWCS